MTTMKDKDSLVVFTKPGDHFRMSSFDSGNVEPVHVVGLNDRYLEGTLKTNL